MIQFSWLILESPVLCLWPSPTHDIPMTSSDPLDSFFCGFKAVRDRQGARQNHLDFIPKGWVCSQGVQMIIDLCQIVSIIRIIFLVRTHPQISILGGELAAFSCPQKYRNRHFFYRHLDKPMAMVDSDMP